MLNKKVAIIVSTYNGEKYIEEQLKSLCNQTYPNVEIYIRDDGSKDETVSILEKYKKENNNIHIIKAQNVGVVGSFYECLREAYPNADYFAYCDQDDIWHEDKIQKAIETLEDKSQMTKDDNLDIEKPKLYFTEFNYCDDELKFMKTSKMNKKGATFRNSLLECICSGNTMVFDKKMAKLVLDSGTQDVCLHDWWLYMIATVKGKIIYDPNPSLEYRRTGNNVTPGGGGFLKLQLFRIKKFLFGDYFKNIKKQIKRFDKIFHDELNKKDQLLINLFTEERYHITTALKKLFYPKMFRQNLLDEILIRFMFLIGKL